jgi:hypothetical protein
MRYVAQTSRLPYRRLPACLRPGQARGMRYGKHGRLRYVAQTSRLPYRGLPACLRGIQSLTPRCTIRYPDCNLRPGESSAIELPVRPTFSNIPCPCVYDCSAS